MWYEFLFFAIFLLLIDISWLFFVMKRIYSKLFSMNNINYFSAFVAYSLLISTFFLIYDHKKDSENTLKKKIKRAALLGGIIYGVYGFTLAVFYDKYPLYLAFVETTWGIVLLSIVTLIAHYLEKLRTSRKK